MTSAMLANATDLALWANRRNAQDTLPVLVRRLVLASGLRVSRVGFPAGEAVQSVGWDGVVVAEEGNAFIANGTSAWEMGVNKNIKAKADDDYTKRTAEPLGVAPSQTTYVFVTPRRWSSKHGWERNRRNENKWADVRVLDADDLEQWLEMAPAVHLWISRLLGKHPSGAVDFDTHWRNWSAATQPEMTADVVLAGRQTVVERLHAWLENPTSPVAIQGESRAEAIAVVVASVQKLSPDRREEALSRAVIVHDRPSWHHLTTFDQPLILAAGFDCESSDIGPAYQGGHSVAVPLGRSDVASSNAIEIPQLSAEEVSRVLMAAGMEADKAKDLAAAARRSTVAFRRKIAVVPELERPSWSRPENARSLVPALLAGRWSAAVAGDQQILAKLANKNYDEFQRDLVRWSNEDDPPVRCVGKTWYLTSVEDALILLGRYLTANDIETFQNIAVEVLSPADPAFDLADDERWKARIMGKSPEHSTLLRTGIANTLAILGARGHAIRITGDAALDAYTASPIRQLLNSNNWQVWASLPLSLLAEAAPDEFLDAVDRGVSGVSPFLAAIFRDKKADIFASAPHTGLLFALETLAWNDQLLARVTVILAKLARIDPGGTWTNRPRASLRSIFLLWLPQTTASLDQRFRAIDALRERLPDVAWDLMCSLLPQRLDQSSPTARPAWREWAPAQIVRASIADYADGIRELTERILDDVNENGARWKDLIERLSQFPRDQYGAVFARLESLDEGQLATSESEIIWHSLRTLLSHHRSCADADWSLPTDQLDRLATILMRFEPDEPLRRYGWLFGGRPLLPEGHEDDWEANQNIISARQCEAVETLCHQQGLNWVADFIEHVERPEQLGAAFARREEADAVADCLLRAHLRPAERRHVAFVSGLINTRVRQSGLGWAIQKLADLGATWSAAARAAFCLCLPFDSRTWKILDRCDDETVREYWKTVVPFFVPGNDVETAARLLLQHGRAGVAADLMQLHLQGSRLPVDLVIDVLEALATQPVDQTEFNRLSANDLSDLLAYVSASDEVDEGRVAKLEWAFLPALGPHNHSPRILIREMARNPDFFVQVVALIYRGEGEAPSEPSEADRFRAERAYELLQSWRWRPLPGMPEDSGFDATALREWVHKARETLQSQGRLATGEHTIGEILSSSPAGDDGAWPHPAVRELIEEIQSEDFEQGLIIGVLNRENVVWRDANEGGNRERTEASRCDQWAQIVSDHWGRTAGMLRKLRDHYLASANDEDQRARLRDDLTP